MGSVASKMSADPRTQGNVDGPVAAPSPLSQMASHNLPLPPQYPPPLSRPGPSVPVTRTSSNGPAPRDINALRAAALKSSRMKKLKAEAEAARSQSATPAPPPGVEEGEIPPPAREEGEISDDGDSSPPIPIAPVLPSFAPPRTQTRAPPRAPEPPASPGITRSTIVSISPSQVASSDSFQQSSESTLTGT